MSHTYKYPKADHTVDAVVIGVDLDADRLHVLLVRRGQEPFRGSHALPGGFVHMDESLEQAVRRELEEETGVQLSYLEQLYTFGDPGRDPRGRVISTAYLSLVRPDGVDVATSGGTDADAAAWFPLDHLPELAFDHARIIDTAITRLRGKLRWQPIGLELLPREFSLSELQRLYEIILGSGLDKRNFRRRVLAYDVLTETDKLRSNGSRPARLYRFDRRKYRSLVSQGIDFEV